MKRLFIADVHANLPALQAVLADAGTADAVVFLGDAVGFGPHPAQCVELLQSLSPVAVIGNHDAAVLSAGGFSPGFTQSRRNLERLDLASTRRKTRAMAGGCRRRRKFPGRKPPTAPGRPHSGDNQAAASSARGALPSPANAGRRIGGIFRQSRRRNDRLWPLALRVFDCAVNGRRFVCIPSAGQPRDADPARGTRWRLTTDGAAPGCLRCRKRRPRRCRIALPAAFIARWLSFLRAGHDREVVARHGLPLISANAEQPPAGMYS